MRQGRPAIVGQRRVENAAQRGRVAAVARGGDVRGIRRHAIQGAVGCVAALAEQIEPQHGGRTEANLDFLRAPGRVSRNDRVAQRQHAVSVSEYTIAGGAAGDGTARDGRCAVAMEHAAAVSGRVAREGAARECERAVQIGNPATAVIGRVAGERAGHDGCRAEIAIEDAAAQGAVTRGARHISGERALLDFQRSFVANAATASKGALSPCCRGSY